MKMFNLVKLNSKHSVFVDASGNTYHFLTNTMKRLRFFNTIEEAIYAYLSCTRHLDMGGITYKNGSYDIYLSFDNKKELEELRPEYCI